MITEQDLQEAIAECQGVKNPNANTCIKLASYYTILNQIKEPVIDGYSFTPSPIEHKNVGDFYYSNTEFMEIVGSMTVEEIMPIMDDLMVTLNVLNPRLYNSVIRKLKGEG